MPIIPKLSMSGISSGVISFAILYFVYSQVINWAANHNLYNQLLMTLSHYVIWLLSGYIAGFVSKSAGILNGAVVGLVTPVVIAIYLLIIFSGWEDIMQIVIKYGLFWLLCGFVLCGLGGLVWDVQRQFL